MVDSDDEFDKRNVRDKFRHERNDYEKRDDRKSRETFPARPSNASRTGRDHRDSYRDRRERISPPPRRDSSPPQAKRARREVTDGSQQQFRVPYGSGLMPGSSAQHGWNSGASDSHPPFSQGSGEASEMTSQPPMMNLKQFLASQDENITDVEAKKRYGEYQTEFKRQQINDFFNLHKDEEWFRSKYHPDEHDKGQEEARSTLKHRCKVFMKLCELGRVGEVVVDIDHSTELVRLLDAAVILMEGGTEFDLKALEVKDTVPEKPAVTVSRTVSESQATSKSVAVDESAVDKVSEKSSDDEDEDDSHPKFTEPLKLEKEPLDDATPPPVAWSDTPTTQESADTQVKKAGSVKNEKSLDDSGSISSSSDSDEEGSEQPGVSSTLDEDAKEKPAAATTGSQDSVTSTSGVNGESGGGEPKPQALHRTLSIFLRNLAATITQQEVEAVCKQYPGFLRVALQDPQPDRRFQRRGWVTFRGDVNVKEICYNLNQIRLRDCDMGAIVNRDLQQRIRPVSGFTNHQQVAKSDIKSAAKIIQNFDNRWNLWDEIEDSTKPTFGFVSKNPIMKNITDYLVDEGSYEEDVLLGEDPDFKRDSLDEVTFERDKELLAVLDRMILYLRIVYSFDYYSTVEYPHEDAMPHRCGIVHARGVVPRGKVTQHDLNEWLSTFEARVMPFVNLKVTLDEMEIVKLGKKNDDDELEKFMAANTQELAKDKWLCPLSGKKFKGPEFVRKHILTKHAERLDELKKDVIYFNTYLMDPRRPQLPEHPVTRMLTNPPPPRENYIPSGHAFHGPPAPPAVMMYRPPVMPHGGPMMYNAPPFHRRGADHFRGGNDYRSAEPPRPPIRRDRTRPDPRPVISYTDLDAPPEVD